ncbi:MAG: dephospho-CoA kinase [Helicobacteraceae bacterium]|jgi:dephospho-CoA kinase|nr:dephospho-CoA kinase [Helicobacteraceae bacterium]
MRQISHGIVVTGGIGSGKSEAANYLRSRGFALVDSDQISREVFAAKTGEIVSFFGTTDRKKIGARIFADDWDRAKLEALLHPEIRAKVWAQCLDLDRAGKPFFVDIPLYFENRADYGFLPRAILIYAPLETRIARLVHYRKMSEEEVFERIDAQIPLEEKRSLATWIIENDSTKDALRAELNTFISTIAKP